MSLMLRELQSETSHVTLRSASSSLIGLLHGVFLTLSPDRRPFDFFETWSTAGAQMPSCTERFSLAEVQPLCGRGVVVLRLLNFKAQGASHDISVPTGCNVSSDIGCGYAFTSETKSNSES
jgi:hypothetical protein